MSISKKKNAHPHAGAWPKQRSVFLLSAIGFCGIYVGPRAQAEEKIPPATVAEPASLRAATTPLDGLTHVHIQSGGGKVVVRATDGPLAQARAEAVMGTASCGLVATRSGDTWRVSTHNTGAQVCEVALILDVPAAAHVSVTMVSGNLLMSGLTGALAVDINEGNAVLGNAIKSLTAHLGRGSLSAQGLRGPAQLTLERGNLQLYAHPEMKGTVTLAVTRGQVTVVVPPRPIALDVALGRGRSSSNVGTDAAAPIRLTGSIDAGDLKIRAQ